MTLHTFSTFNSLFVRPSFKVFAPKSVESVAENMLTSKFFSHAVSAWVTWIVKLLRMFVNNVS